MTNITRWSDSERQQFSHKLEEIIHGPSGVDGSVGFICITYPIEDILKGRRAELDSVLGSR